MDEENVDDLKLNEEVGRVSVDAILHAAKLVKPGASLLDVAVASEKYLADIGYSPAFPINLSINQRAAHYTPTFEDMTLFGENDVVKVDFGAEKNGILGDGALTVDLSGNHSEMIDAAENALEAAISKVKVGVEVREIGREIERVVSSAGFSPIRNLGGHGIGVNELHEGVFIPNYDNGDTTRLEEGQTVAIEPFVTDGKGMVRDEAVCEIYTFVGHAGVRSPVARNVLAEIEKSYGQNPFAARWLARIAGSKFGLYASMSELVRVGAIEPNPVLIESGNGIVTQAEAELVVEKDGCRILTMVKR
jgi:methionyl aminopeptidase